MSRYNPHHNISSLLSVSDNWKSRCLLNNGSLFSTESLWTVPNVDELVSHFVNSPDGSDQSFLEKLKGQLNGVAASVKKLASEMLFVLLLCPSNIKPNTKRETVKTIWDWSDEELDLSVPSFQEGVLDGVGSGGTGFNANRPREFSYIIWFAKEFIALSLPQREALLGDGWRMAKWLEKIPENESRQFRHMLLYLLFPDIFDRIFGGADRTAIVSCFTGENKSAMRKYSAFQLDQRLSEIRGQQESKYGTKDLDFYYAPLKEVWQPQLSHNWLFTWNPSRWDWKSLATDISTTAKGKSVIQRWSCANGSVAVGDRAWLVRLGDPPKGIMAVGNVVSEPYEAPHFDSDKAAAGKTTQYVDIEFTRILDVFRDSFVTESDLAKITIDNQKWFPEPSGMEVKPRSGAVLEKLWNQILLSVKKSVEKPGAEMVTQAPSNLIFYGPPGTGKTYELNKIKERYISSAQVLSREQWLAEQLREVRWFDVVFMALHDLGGKAKVAQIAAHEFVVQKAKILGRTENITQQIWASLQTHALENSATVKYAKRQAPYVFDKGSDSSWSLAGNWKEDCDEFVKLAVALKGLPPTTEKTKRFEFVTFHQAYSYEDFVEGIRPGQDEESGDVVYSVQPGVFRRICERAKNDYENRYAIFIDEINRGNIARIFGELITLIEVDKRTQYDSQGGVIAGMELTLPYSAKEFGVPANLDIYGSMNTADRSIALLDTALRRRFNFRELMPDSKVITGSRGDGYIEDGEGGVINLRLLLDAMNKRIRFLLNRDLTLGHAYLCKVRDFSGLKDVMLNQLVPLLQEYFYNDWHRIQLVFRDVGESDQRIEPQIIIHEQLNEEDVLGFDRGDFENMIEYRVARAEEILPESIRKIYEPLN